jgi:pimeloyl-ACP methyl ester carboxylesterase
MPNLRQQVVEVPFKGKKLTVSTLVIKRSDKWVVGLHGIQSNKELFAELFSQPFLANYSLLAIDFIGFGESDKPEDFSYNIEDQAEVVKYILGHNKIERLHIIGHSMGGMIGTLLLGQLSDKIISFTNLEGNLVLADCGDSKDIIMFTREEFEKVEFNNMKARIRRSSDRSASLRGKWLETMPARVFYQTSQSIVRWSKSGKLQDLFNSSSIKHVYIYGSRNARKAGSVSGSAIKVEIPEAGHFMLLDQPDLCFQAIRKFI